MSGTIKPQIAAIFADPGSVSVKRLAWAFGCAKKDSDEEIALYKALVEKVRSILAERGDP